MIGCSICTLAVQLSSLVGQHQPVLARLLQYYARQVLQVFSCHTPTSRDISWYNIESVSNQLTSVLRVTVLCRMFTRYSIYLSIYLSLHTHRAISLCQTEISKIKHLINYHNKKNPHKSMTLMPWLDSPWSKSGDFYVTFVKK